MNSWDAPDFQCPDIPTMITAEEQKYLYWLGAHYWQDVGHIFEIGPWLGGSTACLASGMRQRAGHPGNKLHVFDNFIWREFMAGRAALPDSNGDCFQPYFERNLAAFTDLTAIHLQALPDDDTPLDELAVLLNNLIAPIIDRGVFRDTRFTRMYLIVVRKPDVS